MYFTLWKRDSNWIHHELFGHLFSHADRPEGSLDQVELLLQPVLLFVGISQTNRVEVGWSRCSAEKN